MGLYIHRNGGVEGHRSFLFGNVASRPNVTAGSSFTLTTKSLSSGKTVKWKTGCGYQTSILSGCQLDTVWNTVSFMRFGTFRGHKDLERSLFLWPVCRLFDNVLTLTLVFITFFVSNDEKDLVKKCWSRLKLPLEQQHWNIARAPVKSLGLAFINSTWHEPRTTSTNHRFPRAAYSLISNFYTINIVLNYLYWIVKLPKFIHSYRFICKLCSRIMENLLSCHVYCHRENQHILPTEKQKYCAI